MSIKATASFITLSCFCWLCSCSQQQPHTAPTTAIAAAAPEVIYKNIADIPFPEGFERAPA